MGFVLSIKTLNPTISFRVWGQNMSGFVEQTYQDDSQQFSRRFDYFKEVINEEEGVDYSNMNAQKKGILKTVKKLETINKMWQIIAIHYNPSEGLVVILEVDSVVNYCIIDSERDVSFDQSLDNCTQFALHLVYKRRSETIDRLQWNRDTNCGYNRPVPSTQCDLDYLCCDGYRIPHKCYRESDWSLSLLPKGYNGIQETRCSI